MSTVLLDTCVLIDYLRRDDGAIQFVESFADRPALSVLSVAEIQSGIRDSEVELASVLFASANVLPVNTRTATIAGDLRRQYMRSHGFDLADALIAATAIEADLPLATLNLKHFSMFPGLERPY